MPKKYEVAIQVCDPEYIAQLIVALVRQGYSVYFNEGDYEPKLVCFTATDEEVHELTGSSRETV